MSPFSPLHEDTPSYPHIFNTDRNIFLSGGGDQSWNSIGSDGTWTFSAPLYLSWFAGRLGGSAKYNIIAAQPSGFSLPKGHVAYVEINTASDGAIITLNECAGNLLPTRGTGLEDARRNIFVIAAHNDIGYTDNPLLVRDDGLHPDGDQWSATGVSKTGFAKDFTAVANTEYTIENTEHGLNTIDLVISIYDSSTPRKQIWPEEIKIAADFTVSLLFSENVNGRVVIVKGRA